MALRDGDQEALNAALRTIEEQVPEAVKVSFQTTDQDYVGFELAVVELSSGKDLADVAPLRFAEVAGSVWPLISGIGWDGVMGEDAHGNATLILGPSGLPRPGSIA
ncbi:hypothetical protein [Actinoplanes awajinensis]|nr:hypothetical protein [Actinoplanes awajinensis]